ncbi:propionyl-CoA synthetase [Allopseudospirillum japonicum]|uniref:Propionyl-CoA synthetase n=1 Tax=Allopseudospirillum japonicum TaxID=64971 RepID=A0A1H6TE27_9GAMM|nr:propionyl-CoA synthetase [Allopseudospirillum japonicum]SEI75337.1 propionyl-CoA synthetase [Allopseudospirillum japonicum]
MTYFAAHAQALRDPEGFWAQQAKLIPWFRQPSRTLTENPDGTHQWFADGELNSCYIALDYQIEQGRGEQIALIYDSPVTETKTQFTYQELKDKVAHFAGALTSLGVGKGDGVIIYMPMVPEAGIAMLACARIGAIHSVVFGGFAPHELAIRINDAKPKVVLTASCGIEFTKVIEYKPLVDAALEQAEHKPERVVVLQRPQAQAELKAYRDVDWYQIQESIKPVGCTPVKSTDPLYIMYTSGTTGKPKGIVRDNGGHAVALLYALRNVYDMQAGDVWMGCSDVGWVVGHSFIMYAPLMGGCTSVFFEGKPVRTPDAGTFWRIVEEYKVNGMFAAPTAFRAIRKEDPEGEYFRQYDVSSLKHIFVAGEKLDSPTYHWLHEIAQKPIYDHWWQTETGWPVTAPLTALGATDLRIGSTNRPVPGYDVQVLDAQGQAVAANETGSIVIKLPLPPGCAQTLWQDHSRYLNSYLGMFKGYYHTGDGGYIDEDGFVYIMGRTDDVINVSGHRLSTGEMEEIVATHSAVAECAVIGVHDDLKGQVPVGLILLKDGVEIDPQTLEQELVAKVRQEIGAIACFNRALVVDRLPKTRSGKILRAILRKIANGETYNPPSTIDDESILPEITDRMRQEGLVLQA